MKRTILPVTLAIFAFSIGQARSQNKQSQPSWSSEHRGLMRLSVELYKGNERGDLTTDDEQKLATKTCAVPDTTVMFLARRYHRDHDFEALAADLTEQSKEVAARASVTGQTNDLATCRMKACGGYWGCFFNLSEAHCSLFRPSNCSVIADRLYHDCFEGVLGPISQPKP
jgi:hypothetical protein